MHCSVIIINVKKTKKRERINFRKSVARGGTVGRNYEV